MLGQRRALGVRVDSQRNINALVEKQQDAKNALAKPVPIFVDEKKAVTKVPVVKRKAYGGRQCMVSEQMAESIDSYLKAVEKDRQIERDFLKNAKIDGRMRGILLDWIMQIQTKFQLAPETFYLSCSILDRIIVPLNVSRQNFQLVGLACIFIASKFEEVLIPNVHDFVYMGGDLCTIDDLFKTERDILRAMKFELSFTYPNHFLRKMRLFMPADDQTVVSEISKLLIDVAMVDYSLAFWLPSEITATSVHLAYKIIQRPCPTELFDLVGVSTMVIAEKSRLLNARLPSHVDEAGKLKGMRLKYKNSEVLKLVDKHIASLKDLNSK